MEIFNDDNIGSWQTMGNDDFKIQKSNYIHLKEQLKSVFQHSHHINLDAKSYR